MISYFTLIQRLYDTEEEFDQFLAGKLLTQDKEIDISPGSGFHFRERKRKNLDGKK
jgi:hypothetical protein